MSDDAKTERLHMLISPAEMKAIDDWGFQNRIRTKAESVRRLCQIGLAHSHHGDAVVRRTERALKATLLLLDKLNESDATKVPKGIRGGLRVVLEEQLEANKAAIRAMIAGSVLSDAEDDNDVSEITARAEAYISKLVGDDNEG